MRTQVLMATVGLALTGFGAGYPTDLIYYSKLDSAADITAPQVGASGEILGSVTFGSGQEGNAALIPSDVIGLCVPFPDGFPIEKGKVEFSAKLMTTKTVYGGGGGSPTFAHMERADTGLEVLDLSISGNDGGGHSGLVLNFVRTRFFTDDNVGYDVPYSSIYGDSDHLAWHHYTYIWNTNGIAGSTDMVRVYIDDKLKLHGKLDASELSQYAINLGAPLKMYLGVGHNHLPLYIDELKVWKTDTPSENPVELPVVSEVTAKQHYPWCGKIDIGYTVAGSTDGLQVKITVKDNANNKTYEAKTFDVKPTAAAGMHTVVWNATADGVTTASQNMVATVSLIVPEN